MRLFNEGRVGCFSPVTEYPDRGQSLIRPLILAPEKDYGIHRTERKPEILLPYEKEGYDYAVRNMDKIKGFIS